MTTWLSDDREAALRVAYDIHKDELEIHDKTRGEFEDFLADWTVQAIVRDDEVIGARYTRDGRLHVSVHPNWHGRWMTRGILKQIFDMPRVIVTRMPPENPVYGLLTRLGFTDIGGDTMVREN